MVRGFQCHVWLVLGSLGLLDMSPAILFGSRNPEVNCVSYKALVYVTY